MKAEGDAPEDASSSGGQSDRAGRYRPLLQLDSGGMADVYLALATGLAGVKRLAVIKKLKRDLARDEEYVAMFLEEARLGARFNHPNVVQTYEVARDGGDWFIAMEFLAGQTLARLRKKAKGSGGVPLALQLKILSDVLAGLVHAHKLTDFDGAPLSVVHRDINPQNVFVGYDGQVKILDFGIAKAASSMVETRTGWLKGKLSYMAPEQIYADSVDRRADIFSVGAMLWEAATGRRLWAGAEEITIMRRVVQNDLPWLTGEPGVAPELVAIYLRALAPRLDERYASAAEMQSAIDDYMERTAGPCAQRDIARYVQQLFAKERQTLRDVITTEVARPAPSSESSLPVLASGPISDPAPSSRPGLVPVGPGCDEMGPPAGLAKTLRPMGTRRGSARWLASVAIVAVTLAVVLATIRHARRSEPAPAASYRVAASSPAVPTVVDVPGPVDSVTAAPFPAAASLAPPAQIARRSPPEKRSAVRAEADDGFDLPRKKSGRRSLDTSDPWVP